MKLYSRKKLHGYAKDIYFEHNYNVPGQLVGGLKTRTCYHYEVATVGRQLEAIRLGGKPIDVTVEGMGCGSYT